ncbi:DUF262 domain-containing protein [Clostridium perfringens]|uniref:DUF262 domain-containing protein n=1 Tax=Clostridium perfringens TaxID=1502 RepID=UPI0013E302CB|nr:DUF262 domain-containing protein [Clostridium perfringens]MDK0549805.1 DUF262 domain-containing protein [Clostridium perfringens]MDK0552635.1 DUF262 domain-containing protein [Clostridium perfringens]MDK0833942.1 DUF262 domain-containing protein [Clostridium perfringens]NGU11967.1 DUF262 domain-containing protein [Clostridium perfringens]HEE9847384.1 DUF262 domain-containing protein [Clostridium perfringens]
MDNIDIINSVDEKIDKVRTRSLDLSFNELMDMYQSGELIINPEYQRMFRWNNVKQSQFIESLILELPVPPIFVIELDDNVYELIDGLQRISSYLHFRGSLTNNSSIQYNSEDDELEDDELEDDFLKLIGCDMLKELEGKSYNDLPKAIQIRLKRNFIRVEVLRKENDSKLRYHMFKRLNSGGEKLSDQEIRNCTIRILDNEFNNCIIRCSSDKNFKNTISKIDSKKIKEKIDQEMVLRFFALKNNLENYKHPFSEYLTNYMEDVAEKNIEFNIEREEENFKKTFFVLNSILGEDVFSSILGSERFKSDFVLYHFDAFTVGIQEHLDNIEKIIRDYNKSDLNKLSDIFKNIKKSDALNKHKTGSKLNIQKRVELVANKIKENL